MFPRHLVITLQILAFVESPIIVLRHKSLGFFFKQNELSGLHVPYENDNAEVIKFIHCLIDPRIPNRQYCLTCRSRVSVWVRDAVGVIGRITP